MRLGATYSHHHGVDIWKDRDLYEWITDVFEAPHLKVGECPTTKIRDYVKQELETQGWGFNIRVDADSDLTVFSRKDDLVIQMQTGNISRYAYDLLKIQHLYMKKEIDAALLAVPTKAAALKIGSNLASCERIWNELNVFNRLITTPLMLVSFE